MPEMVQPDRFSEWMANGDPVTVGLLIVGALLALWLLVKVFFGIALRLLLVAVAAGILWAALVSTGYHHDVMDRIRELPPFR